MRTYGFLFLLTFVFATAEAQLLYDPQVLAQRRIEVLAGQHGAAYRQLLRQADEIVKYPPTSVMDKRHTAPSGNKHDYCSLAYYAWPNPNTANGLPYVIRDGEPNPAYKEYDFANLGNLAVRVNTLALAWYFSGKEAYAEKAVQFIRTWFLDKATAMKPNLWYCQVVPGWKSSYGANVLDGTCVADLLNGVLLLQHSPSFPSKDQKRLRSWVKRFCKNVQAAEWGRHNLNYTNNHTTAYDYQIAAYLIYTGQEKAARSLLEGFPQRRLFPQLAADGSFPKETERSRGFNYSWYNMQFMVNVMLLGKRLGLDLTAQTNEHGQTFYSAVDYLLPYVGKPQAAWPHQETGNWSDAQRAAQKELYRIGHALRSNYNSHAATSDNDIYRLTY